MLGSEKRIEGKHVAIIAADGFEQSELFDPKEALEKAGAKVTICSLKEGEIKGWKDNDWGKSIAVDRVVASTNADDYDALLIPGGVMNPDKLRMNEDAVQFVSQFVLAGKPIGAICHGPWVLIETDILEGRTVTSYSSIKTDLINAGAKWVDEEVVADNGLVTSRKPSDIPAFCAKLIEEIAEGAHTPLKPNPEVSDEMHKGLRH